VKCAVFPSATAAEGTIGIPRKGEIVFTQIDVSASNSLIESWWRSLKHGWLFMNHLNNVATLLN